jgi:hypothetical protein
MRTVEQLLASGKPAFSIDDIACMQHAEIIKPYKRLVATHIWSSKPKQVQLAFKVAFISICHQFNWDFLQNSLAENLLNQNQPLTETLSKASSDQVAHWLKEYPKQERVRAKERAHLLRDVGRVLADDFGGDLDKFYTQCENAPIGNGAFHKLMDRFEAFRSDQLRNVLTHDLIKEYILTFNDAENIQPAIDYHIMRLYLRSGRVIPNDKAIFRFLEGAPNPRGALVKQLRQTVAAAEQLTAFYAGLNVADVNYIEWQIGRSICLNEKPLCLLPDTNIEIAEDIAPLCDQQCPYKKQCLSFNNQRQFILFEEPKYISKDY